ncbi:coatomer subunit alpha [Dinochytrium kinnereticum]|nr:coatomer subunit alpha [Dinochytrium kinnereticum]
MSSEDMGLKDEDLDCMSRLNKFIDKWKASGQHSKKATLTSTGVTDHEQRKKMSSLEPEEIDSILAEVLKRKKELEEKKEQQDLYLLATFLKKAKSEKIKELIKDDMAYDLEIEKRPAGKSLITDAKSLDLDSKSRMLRHFDDIEQGYLDWRLRAKIYYADRLLTGAASIISSIGFDRDDEFFATAGVTRKIKIFDYENVVTDYRDVRGSNKRRNQGFISARRLERSRSSVGFEDAVVEYSKEGEANDDGRDMDDVPRFPILEMGSRSKISCLSWNPYIKSHMISSDYEGIVTLWDANQGTPIHSFEEHEKRTWSVHFCQTDPLLFASGGDDTKVKIWSTSQKASIACIDSKANVCSVKWNPNSSYELAFGSADHNVHYYDLRKVSAPVVVFTGHRKAVSYVDFLSRSELVSASTDCTLRCWNLDNTNTHASTPTPSSPDPFENRCTRVFSGHVNEKNFVGLSVNSTGEFISCGSETNSIFTYYSRLSQPIIVHPFGKPIESIHGGEVPEDDPSHFVSSVCWKRKSPDILLSANSQGRIKVLQMQ